MTAYGTMQESEAFRNLCRAYDLPQSEFNEVGKDLDSYKNHPKWKDIIEESKRFIGVIDSVSPHPCANLLLSQPISEEVGVIKVGDEYCALIDSDTSDAWKYLKNDYLTVTVWKIIADGFKAVNKPIPDVRTLSKLVDGDEEVWKLYEKGLTATLNQTGTDSGTPQVVQYKPKSIRELSAWVSAIRPSFASMKSYFLNREPFSYGIPAFDKLLEASDNFILYQEDIMKALVYAGFSEDTTYGLLKAIAKKKEGIIEPIHDKFIEGFVEAIGREQGGFDKEAYEQAKKVWRILEDAVGYGFNSSHAYSVALDSVYGAYLKAKHPLEYYSVVLNIYEKNTTTQAKIMKELDYFNIDVLPIEFGKSKAHYSADHNTGSIYKGIASIKNMNAKVAEELFELSKNEYESFSDLLMDIADKTSANKTHMNILIRLDFFSSFGEKHKLLKIYEIFREGKGLFYKNSHTEKTKNQRIELRREKEKEIISQPDEKIDLFEQITFEKDILGYAITKIDNVSPNMVLVTDINKGFKNKGKPKLTLYQLSTGKEYMVKVEKAKFYYNENDELLRVGDIIKILEVEDKPAWKMDGGKWVKDTSRMEMHLERCKIVRRKS